MATVAYSTAKDPASISQAHDKTDRRRPARIGIRELSAAVASRDAA